MVRHRSGGGRMAQRGRPGLRHEQKRELWSRWKAGESLSEIGRALGKQPGSIHGVVASNGGYVPATRRRSPRVLALAEREEISRGLAGGLSVRAIATRPSRAPSTITREISRHGGRTQYRAARADDRAWDRARRPKPCKLSAHPRLRELVARRLAEEWSPQQISGWLARTYPGEQALQVSTETIYRSLFVQGRGVLRKELTAHLRTRRTMRRARNATTKGQGRGGITDAISIRERPPDVAVYFCDPQSPWQRGTNENTNGLLRQYFPKKTDLSIYSQNELDAVAVKLNTRPRKTLGYETPADRFGAIVASTP